MGECKAACVRARGYDVHPLEGDLPGRGAAITPGLRPLVRRRVR